MSDTLNIFAIGNVLDPHVSIRGRCRACTGTGKGQDGTDCAACGGSGQATALVRLGEIVSPLGSAEFVGTSEAATESRRRLNARCSLRAITARSRQRPMQGVLRRGVVVLPLVENAEAGSLLGEGLVRSLPGERSSGVIQVPRRVARVRAARQALAHLGRGLPCLSGRYFTAGEAVYGSLLPAV